MILNARRRFPKEADAARENTAAVEMLAHHIRNLIEKANMM